MVLLLFTVELPFSNVNAQRDPQRYTKKSLDKIAGLADKCDKGDKKACMEIVNIARNKNEYGTIREAAIKQITDKDTLKSLIISDDITIMKTALDQLNDQTIFKEIVDKCFFCPVDILPRITDQTFKGEYIKNCKEPNDVTINCALGGISDILILDDIINNAKSNRCKEKAIIKRDKITVQNITDETKLYQIAKNDHNINKRELAIKKINDKILLADLVKSERDLDLRKKIFDRIFGKLTENLADSLSDKNLLLIIRCCDNKHIIISAFNKISTKEPALKLLDSIFKTKDYDKYELMELDPTIRKYYNNLNISISKGSDKYNYKSLSNDGKTYVLTNWYITIKVENNGEKVYYRTYLGRDPKTIGSTEVFNGGNSEYDVVLDNDKMLELTTKLLNSMSQDDLKYISQNSIFDNLRQNATVMLK